MKVLAHRDGLFGPIRVLERHTDRTRLYCIKGSVQTMVRPDGVSVFGYVHAAKLLLVQAQTVLLIGGAGGSLATMLARRGKTVTVVDVEPTAEELARTYFGLDERVHWVTAEGIPFVEQYNGAFDAIAIDACDSNGLVPPFDEADALARLLQRGCPQGSLVVNVVHEDGVPPRGRKLASEIVERGLSATLYQALEGWEGNEVLHVRAHGPTDTLASCDYRERPAETRSYLMSLRAITLGKGPRP
ncbi:MAG: hypothetical protein SGJ23_03315 [Alphaproteobacteria bacterium]|nr:hypothetical protein [Alphaproteobacteria bacterium]